MDNHTPPKAITRAEQMENSRVDQALLRMMDMPAPPDSVLKLLMALAAIAIIAGPAFVLSAR